MIAAILFLIAQQAQVSNLVFEVKDIQFEVVSFGAATQDLAVKESDTETVIDMSADVLFDFDKSDLKPAAEQTLSKAAALIQEKAKKGASVRIEGHTDAKGNDAYNQKLSERRAEAVKSWFIQKEGLGSMVFATEGFGARKPVAPNKK